MNLLHLKYAVEVEKTASITKAAENLYMGQPSLSRAIRELEDSLGIQIFKRTPKGIFPTPKGEEFIRYAQSILKQIDEVERHYKQGALQKQKLSVSVPRACYISDAFVQFSKSITEDPTEIFYKETNSQRTINNVLNNDYKLGNILWNKDFMYLIDFDACCLSNPAVSLAESSFSLSRQNNKVNRDFYKEYLTTYIKKFGPLNTDYQVALDVAMNGKLQWLNYLLSKCNKKDQTIINDTKYMIEELALYYDNKEEFYKLYLTAVKNKTK